MSFTLPVLAAVEQGNSAAGQAKGSKDLSATRGEILDNKLSYQEEGKY